MTYGTDRLSATLVHDGVLPSGTRRLVLFQFWDNVAFYGSRLLLVLYLIDVLAHPDVVLAIWGLSAIRGWAALRLGLITDQPFVSAIFGLFGMLAFVTPVLGGWLSDRFISRRHAVIVGSLMMTVGHAMLALQVPFLAGLALLACGNGFYRGTTSAMLAGLFPRDDPRLAGAFQLSYTAGNVAGMVTPLICGTLGELVGWSWGFGAAAVAMLIGLATFLSIPAVLLAEPHAAAHPTLIKTPSPLTPRLLLIAGLALFMIGNEQLGNAIVIWLKASVDRRFGTWTMPLTWFFSVTPVAVAGASIVLARRPLIGGAAGLRWRMLRGGLLGAGAWAMLALMAMTGPVPAAAFLLFLLSWGIAFALVLPSGAGLMAELTPPAARGRWLGLYFLAVMIADIAIGWLGGLYGQMSSAAFIAGHAAIVLIGAGLLAPWPQHDRSREFT